MFSRRGKGAADPYYTDKKHRKRHSHCHHHRPQHCHHCHDYQPQAANMLVWTPPPPPQQQQQAYPLMLVRPPAVVVPPPPQPQPLQLRPVVPVVPIVPLIPQQQQQQQRYLLPAAAATATQIPHGQHIVSWPQPSYTMHYR